jgi:hypothetical protein
MEIKGLDVLNELFSVACKQNEDAVQVCQDIWKIAHLWDDLVDGDTVSIAEINEAMTAAWSGLNNNAFFASHLQHFNGFMSIILANWQTANEFEEKKIELGKAWVLRAQLYNVPVLCAFLIAGQEWANQVSLIAWQTYGEKYSDYLKEMTNA